MDKIRFFILFISSICSFGQEHYGGSLSVRVFHQGSLIEFPSEHWSIELTDITLAKAPLPSLSPINTTQGEKGYYDIIPERSLGGALVGEGFHLDIIHHQDTMRIYPPSIRSKSLTLDSISFVKGVYKIPENVYDFKETSKAYLKQAHKKIVPNLYSDWELFQQETYKCYIEQIESLDFLSQHTKYYYEGGKSDWRNWQSLHPPNSRTSYSFYENTIVKYSYATKHITIFEVKDFSNDHYFDTGKPAVVALYVKDDTIFGLINKGNRILGIYKLHFVEEKPNQNLDYLEKKQVYEEYEAQVKTDTKNYKGATRERYLQEAHQKLKEILKTRGFD